MKKPKLTKNNSKSKKTIKSITKKEPLKIRWLSEETTHDYYAARSYLSLIYNDTKINSMIQKFENSSVSHFKAKDIFRASQLSLLGVSNHHVKRDKNKIKQGVRLVPILLVRDDKQGRVIIADGYHRLCAVYKLDKDANVPCKII